MEIDVTTESTEKEKRRSVVFRDGRIYFTRQAERKFYFAVGAVLFACGAFIRLGVF